VWAGADNVDQLDQAFASIVAQRADSLIEMGMPFLYEGRRAIVDFAARERIPAVYSQSAFTEAGGLLVYGPDIHALYERLADYVDKILKGASVADLPFESPTQFDLVVNMKTAKALGLTIPQSILLRATEIIE
jgi:putative ABC transport system substrate-binding protein